MQGQVIVQWVLNKVQGMGKVQGQGQGQGYRQRISQVQGFRG